MIIIIHKGQYLQTNLLCTEFFRLQYFARGSQTYHSQLKAALKGKNFIDLKEEQVGFHFALFHIVASMYIIAASQGVFYLTNYRDS